jgi:hypothetical protein
MDSGSRYAPPGMTAKIGARDIKPAGEDASSSPLVIPGHDEVASPESIPPPTLQPNGFRACASRIPE